ncbi:MAG TPA: hypothetical protein VNP95_05275 [Thermomicrobiales bacterium]|nr:hypothetical protein [Thermomicrobiales bacterium]
MLACTVARRSEETPGSSFSTRTRKAFFSFSGNAATIVLALAGKTFRIPDAGRSAAAAIDAGSIPKKWANAGGPG